VPTELNASLLAFKRNAPEEYAVFCADVKGFDRELFHVEMHAEMIRFFDAAFRLNK